MKHAFYVALASLFCLITAPADAQQDPIREVISSQIDAFQVDDFDAAFAHASPFIQRVFGSADNFGTMVRKGYPMVWRPADVRFLGLETRKGGLWQDVMIRDADGRIHIVEYEMIEGENGWKINGVRMRTDTAGSA